MSDIESILKVINEQSNPRDNAFRVMSKNIWDKEMLKQMHRFNKQEIAEILKNLIVIYIYSKRWKSIKVIHEIKPIREYPHFKIITRYDNIDDKNFIKNSMHHDLITQTIELYIGRDGLARKEIFDFMTAYERSVQQANANQQPKREMT